MLQYLVILLDDAACSFCHYGNERPAACPMPLETLREGIHFAMCENLNVQFVYPATPVSSDMAQLVETIDHIKIKPLGAPGPADVTVVDGWDGWTSNELGRGRSYVLRTTGCDLSTRTDLLADLLRNVDRINLVLTDIEHFTDADFETYAHVLDTAADVILAEAHARRFPQLSALTDRLLLTSMNNCGAAETQLTLAPDGRFYPCPAFYQASDGYAVGSLADGPAIPNAQLYRLDHAPLCRRCDAWQCRRCVWMNRRTTFEVNTPSHEQCVLAHTERSASRRLASRLRQDGILLEGLQDIPELNYNDPFDVREKW